MSLVDALVPHPAERVDLEGAALTAWLADRYALEGDAWLRVNLVGALGGQSTGPSGTSEDLTGGIDRVLLRALRRSGDVVLVGAGTARGESLPLPADRPLAVATLRGDLPRDAVPAPRQGRRALVLCPGTRAEALAERLGDRAEVLPVAGDPAVRPAALIDALGARGLHRVVCEGGGALAGRLLAAGLVDEFDQTTAPIAVSPGPPVLGGHVPPAPARLLGLLRDATDRLYARWSFRAV